MRKKWSEAVSIGFYIILAVDFVLSVVLSVLVGINLLPIMDARDLTGALIGVDGAILGFMITIFALYFTHNMSEGMKELLKKYGFYWQIPKDMIRSVILLTVSILCAIVSYFIQSIAQNIIIMLSIVQFFSGLALALYVTLRFFTILKHQ